MKKIFFTTLISGLTFFGCATKQTGTDANNFFYNSAEGLAIDYKLSNEAGHLNIIYPNGDASLTDVLTDTFLSIGFGITDAFIGGVLGTNVSTYGMFKYATLSEVKFPTNQSEITNYMIKNCTTKDKSFNAMYLVSDAKNEKEETSMVTLRNLNFPYQLHLFYNKNNPVEKIYDTRDDFLPAFNKNTVGFVGNITCNNKKVATCVLNNYMKNAEFVFYSTAKFDSSKPYKINIYGDKIVSISRVDDTIANFIKASSFSTQKEFKNKQIDSEKGLSLEIFNIKQQNLFSNAGDFQYGDFKIPLEIKDGDDDLKIVMGFEKENDKAKSIAVKDGMTDYYAKDFVFDKAYPIQTMFLAYNDCTPDKKGIFADARSGAFKVEQIIMDNPYTKINKSTQFKRRGCIIQIDTRSVANELKLLFQKVYNSKSVKNRKMGIYALAITEEKLYETFLNYLTKSSDANKNEKLLINIAKINPEVFRRIKFNSSNIKHIKNSILTIPDDADFVFCAENFDYLKNVNEYLDNKGAFKELGFDEEKIDYTKKYKYDVTPVKNTPKGDISDVIMDLEDMWYGISEAYDEATNQASSKHSTDNQAQVAFDAFKGRIKKMYYDYLLADVKYKSALDDKWSEAHGQVAEYFKYKQYPQAKEKYKQGLAKMKIAYIEPDEWCGDGFCPSRKKATQIIKKEADKEWNKKSDGFNHNLKFWEFLQTKSVKTKIFDNMKLKYSKDDLNGFNYSYNDFARITNKKVDSKYNEELQKTLKEQSQKLTSKALYKKYGVTKIVYPNGWSDFIRSKEIQKVLSKYYKGVELTKFTDSLEQKDLSGF